ncbi:hypothetical protein EJ04DRAFT_506767 [Polyplosphaeria fusca]|uniref:Endoplasmic reticulum lectin n=1 Tax=Polyplosphaeria fusca TaxID=682080 RepID=A0A9P4QKV8_9PLEO|nr:hypothetical protein EJ04DRAFT_506767 [Polyplosphaeria fusca]
MRNFWALPAVLRIALASPHAFSVFDDLLAYPQYEVLFPDTYILEHEATALLSQPTSSGTSSVTHKSQETQDLSKPDAPSASPTSDEAALEHIYEAVTVAGQRYLCSIPVIPEAEPQNATATAEETKAAEEKELMRASDRGWELLEGMQGNCIYYLSGWWSYSFCYKGDVKQFHSLTPARGVPVYPPVEDTSVKSFILGSYPEAQRKGKGKEARKTLGSEEEAGDTIDDEGNTKPSRSKGLELAKLVTHGTTRYMVQQLTDGTECDLTGRPRKIEVQYHCNPQASDKIAMIKETSTCSYLMIIYTPRLCNDAAFMPPQENLAHPISCQPVLASTEIDAWEYSRLEEKVRDSERLMEDMSAATNPLRDMAPGAEGSSKKRSIIGGIEVGAQRLVGSEGKVIEKSVVVGGGKEVYVATVATSDGKQLSTAEMKKLNIADPKNVEKLKRELQKFAGRKSWKLDLVDTPRGREYRGIIEAEDEEEGGGKEEKEGKGRGMRKEKGEEGEEGGEEGSEEVYKDEL